MVKRITVKMEEPERVRGVLLSTTDRLGLPVVRIAPGATVHRETHGKCKSASVRGYDSRDVVEQRLPFHVEFEEAYPQVTLETARETELVEDEAGYVYSGFDHFTLVDDETGAGYMGRSEVFATLGEKFYSKKIEGTVVPLSEKKAAELASEQRHSDKFTIFGIMSETGYVTPVVFHAPSISLDSIVGHESALEETIVHEWLCGVAPERMFVQELTDTTTGKTYSAETGYDGMTGLKSWLKQARKIRENAVAESVETPEFETGVYVYTG